MNGDQLRDQGIDSVLTHAEQWRGFAMSQLALWLQWKKRQGVAQVTMEEFKQDLLQWFPDNQPHHHNCWGAITRTAAVAGLLVPTDRYVKMKSSAAHSRHAKLWEVA